MNLPDRIGRYSILGLLGQGAMGIVYRGRDDSLERDVAVKVLLGQGSEAISRERFQREARAVARLQHANIVTVYELGEHAGAPFMAMELLEGVDLQRAIEAGIRPDPKATLPVVLQILAGLAEAHDNGIVHRDMKPSNVFLPERRAAKIMDFGLARVTDTGASATGEIVGTPNYMSPEQVRGASIDGRSDLFSTGLILYELVTGEKAFQGDSVVSLVFKIAHEDADLSLIPSGAKWERLRGVLERTLQRSPDDRYPDAQAMSADLGAALRDLGGAADWASTPSHSILMGPVPRRRNAPDRTPSSPEPAAPVPISDPGGALPPAPAPAAPPPGVGPSRRTALGLAAAMAGLGAVLLVGGLALWAYRARPAASGSREAALLTSTTPVSPGAVTSPTPEPPAALTAEPTPSATAEPAPLPDSTPAPTPEPTPKPTPRPVLGDIDRANALLEQRRYREALAEAKAVRKRDPFNEEAQIIAEDAEVGLLVEACIPRVRAALRKGDQDGAKEELRTCLAVAPSDARLLQLWREATR